MIQKKICMVGSFAVGKSSLVSRFVQGKFSDAYQTTVGVKIDRKELTVDERLLRLILWDLHGEDDFQKIRATYLRGSAGVLLVADGTRRSTLETAWDLRRLVEQAVGAIPVILLVNKHDLTDNWDVPDALLAPFEQAGIPVLLTSAKSGARVEEAFERLARAMVDAPV